MSITTESYWVREYTPAPLINFGNRLKSHFGCVVYYKGNTAHLTGRHRSRNWVKFSAYSRDRSYGTKDARDLSGPGDAIRATDVMISGATLRAVCARLDKAVRAGQLPELAEWFGTINGSTVVGWYEGHASSSDSSHLTHLHLGFWTNYVLDEGFFNRLFAVMTGGVVTKEGGDLIGLEKGNPQNDKDEVKALQVMLKNAGFDPGDIDGDYGPATSDAVLKLRKSVGSSATNGDRIDGYAFEQIYRVYVTRWAAKVVPDGPKGDPGPAGPPGPPGDSPVLAEGTELVVKKVT